jgi:hypothetical protein
MDAAARVVPDRAGFRGSTPFRLMARALPRPLPGELCSASGRPRGVFDVKPCPTCGREITDAASVCESCDAWAAALVDTRPPDSAEPAGEQATAASAAAATTAKRAKPGGRRELLFIGGAAIAVALTGFALFGGGSPSSGPVTNAATSASAAPAAPPPPAPAGVQKWSAENQAAWLGNRRRAAAFELPAENIVKTWFGPVRPSLVVRCAEHKMEAFVFVGSPMKIEPRVEGKTVTISVDGEPVRTERWPDSDDHDALFAPDSAAFTARLRQARTLRFGWSPHNSSDAVAEFYVPGLDALIGAAAKECGPK